MRKWALVFSFALAASPASAHKLKVFATAVGADISGYGYFSPGGRAQDSEVTITADAKVIATRRTNAEGEFAYTAQSRADHVFSLDAGDGHVATYKIAADELPDAPGAAAVAADPTSSPAGSQPRPQILPPGAVAGTPAEIRAMIEQGVAHQLRPLREQIDAWQEKLWLHDVLGGFGYIVGIAGLAYGLSATRKQKAPAASIKEARR